MVFGSKATNRQSATVIVANGNNANYNNNQVIVRCLIVLERDTTFKVILENGQPLPEGIHVQTHQIQQQVQQLRQRQQLQRGQQQQQSHRLPAPVGHVAHTGAHEPHRRKKLLNFWTINKALQMLDAELGEHGCGNNNNPVKMVVLGGAQAVRQLRVRFETVAVDMMLDPHLDGAANFHEKLRWCIDQVARAAHLEHDWMNDHYKNYFTQAARDREFHRAAAPGKRPNIYNGKHLKVYGIGLEVALEMKLRRMLDRDRNHDWDLSDATKLVDELTNQGIRPLSFARCQRLDCNKKWVAIPGHAIQLVQERYTVTHQGKQGIVDLKINHKTRIWEYKDLNDNWVPYNKP